MYQKSWKCKLTQNFNRSQTFLCHVIIVTLIIAHNNDITFDDKRATARIERLVHEWKSMFNAYSSNYAQQDLNVRVKTQILCNSNDGQKRLETFFPKFSFQKHKTKYSRQWTIRLKTRKYHQQRCYRNSGNEYES